LGTQLPWYSLLLWPPFLLCCGPVLVWLVHPQPALKPAWPAVARRVPGFWALLGALLLTWTERKRPEVQEALIGVLFVLASTAQILLLANNPHGGEALKDLLAGQILWVSTEQLVRAAVLTALFLLVWFRWRERIGMMTRARSDLREEGSAAATLRSYMSDRFELGEVVAWIFNNEMDGYRIK
jgi:hypothetical protein